MRQVDAGTARSLRRSLQLLSRFDGRQLAIFFDSSRAGGKFIAGTRHRDDEPRRLGVRLDLSPQPADMHIDAAAIQLLAMPGYRLTQLIARQHAARITYECNEQRKLRPGQRHLASVRMHEGPTGQVDPAALNAQSRRCQCGSGLPQGKRSSRRGGREAFVHPMVAIDGHPRPEENDPAWQYPSIAQPARSISELCRLVAARTPNPQGQSLLQGLRHLSPRGRPDRAHALRPQRAPRHSRPAAAIARSWLEAPSPALQPVRAFRAFPSDIPPGPASRE